jgi:hypothetical protein
MARRRRTAAERYAEIHRQADARAERAIGELVLLGQCRVSKKEKQQLYDSKYMSRLDREAYLFQISGMTDS